MFLLFHIHIIQNTEKISEIPNTTVMPQ